ncbi:MAG: LytTR family DNA-binding domain-containing protein [Bacteroidota bacterium]|nr:LytTR family DNA-binding domain-containing protein [Bacteroidota bacterium]
MNKHKICVLIIDSEPESLQHIVELLQTNPLVSEIKSAADSDEALLKLTDCNPDMVLLEFPLKGKAGNELMRLIQTKLKETILVFVSNTKEYAANAIHSEVYNYLLKPVTKAGLEKITYKVHLHKKTNIQERINQIIEKTPAETRFKIQTVKGYLVVDPEEILYCKADGFYSEIYLTNNRVELSQLSLSKLDEMLNTFNFLRVSRSYLINQKYIRKIYRGTNTIILAFGGKEYEVKGSKLHIKELSKIDTE